MASPDSVSMVSAVTSGSAGAASVPMSRILQSMIHHEKSQRVVSSDTAAMRTAQVMTRKGGTGGIDSSRSWSSDMLAVKLFANNATSSLAEAKMIAEKELGAARALSAITEDGTPSSDVMSGASDTLGGTSGMGTIGADNDTFNDGVRIRLLYTYLNHLYRFSGGKQLGAKGSSNLYFVMNQAGRIFMERHPGWRGDIICTLGPAIGFVVQKVFETETQDMNIDHFVRSSCMVTADGTNSRSKAVQRIIDEVTNIVYHISDEIGLGLKREKE